MATGSSWKRCRRWCTSAFRKLAPTGTVIHVLNEHLGEDDEKLEGFLYQTLMGLASGVRGNPLKTHRVIMEGE